MIKLNLETTAGFNNGYIAQRMPGEFYELRHMKGHHQQALKMNPYAQTRLFISCYMNDKENNIILETVGKNILQIIYTNMTQHSCVMLDNKDRIISAFKLTIHGKEFYMLPKTKSDFTQYDICQVTFTDKNKVKQIKVLERVKIKAFDIASANESALKVKFKRFINLVYDKLEEYTDVQKITALQDELDILKHKQTELKEQIKQLEEY